MQTFVSIIDRVTNVKICSTEIDLLNFENLELSPEKMFNFIWDNAIDNGMITGDRNKYIIQLFNQHNHIIDFNDFKDVKRIDEFEKNGGIKGKIVYLQSYKAFRNHKIRQDAFNFGSVHQ